MSSWLAPLLRAVPAIVLAIVVTFSADHSAPLGLTTFGIFGALAGAVIVVFALRAEQGTTRSLQLAQGGVTAVAGIAALAVVGGGLPFLIFLVSGWAAITGFLELYLGLRQRGTEGARDLLFVGGLTVVLAIAVLLVPAGFSQPYIVDDVEYQLTASVIIVGLLGAYWAILGVFLTIAAFSLKWADAPAPVETKA